MSEIIIREAEEKDAYALLEYMERIGQESDNLSYGAEGLGISIEQERTFLRAMHEDPHSVYYCAWKNEECVGTGNLSSMPRRMNHRAELAISVVKSEWNRGIGSRLMKHLIAYAKENSLEILNLEVRSDNVQAIHLYEKFGFKQIGTFPAFFKIQDEYIDFELMWLDLRSSKVGGQE